MKKLFNKRVLSLIMAAVLCLGVMAACGSNNNNGASNSGSNTGSGDGASSSTKDTMTIVFDQEIVSADPADQAQRATAQFMLQMYETMLYFDENNDPAPLLAESVEQLDDLTYQVKLKEGIKFQTARR